MKQKYNIALIPNSKSDQFIKFAKNLSPIADQYYLGDRSLPHITLCQFMSEDAYTDLIWKKVCESVENKSVSLTLKDFSCISVDNSAWVSLLPETSDILRKMHCAVAEIIKNPLNRSFENYDPHMTLINTKDKNYEENIKEFLKLYSPISDMFVLAVGRSDAVGQFTEVLHKVRDM